MDTPKVNCYLCLCAELCLAVCFYFSGLPTSWLIILLGKHLFSQTPLIINLLLSYLIRFFPIGFFSVNYKLNSFAGRLRMNIELGIKFELAG